MLFLAITFVPATALLWLSWRILEQDRALETQRIQERLEHAADLIAAALERRLAEIEQQLPAWAASPPAGWGEDARIVELTPHNIDAHPSLPYLPTVPATKEPANSLWAAAETFEFQQQDYAQAITAFRELSGSKDLLIQAGALVRLGRNLRKNNQHEEALAVYKELAQYGSLPVGEVPAELLARQARCRVLEELNQVSELQRAGAALYADLRQGRWPIDRSTFEFHSQEAHRWLGLEPDAQVGLEEALALAAAAEWLWEEWQVIGRGEASLSGRRSVWVNSRSVLVLWRGSAEKLVALVASPRYLASQWSSIWQSRRVALTLTDVDGHHVLGAPGVADEHQAVRAAAHTRLPWTLSVVSTSPNPDLVELAGRRQLLLAGLALMAFLVLSGSYFIARSVTRELAVARMQSDFVSAVSHEFRTPLTSMRHLIELLVGGVVSGQEHRHQYYAILARETERLHRLVESLLNFGRMEAGAQEYCFEPVDPTDLVKDVVEEFQAETATDSHRIELSAESPAPMIHADREALSRALWNLLDNARKYSPDCPTICVELAPQGEQFASRVRDGGQGIPSEEQKEIFQKFARGALSKALNVTGTGIGLAMVQHIVQAHGGQLRLESQPGHGSTFTIVLPVGKEEK
ncbi:HAMP domain-containing histidine kinase [Acidobacteria bacterium AH-259-L09]|nr:HAMP domain-containing histidine kinase [Acidobacteria bacterium AH-259-L09]